MPDEDSSEFQLNIQAPEGTSLEETQVEIARSPATSATTESQYTISSVAIRTNNTPYQGTIYVRLVNIADASSAAGDDGFCAGQDFEPSRIRRPALAHQVSAGAFMSAAGMSAASVHT